MWSTKYANPCQIPLDCCQKNLKIKYTNPCLIPLDCCQKNILKYMKCTNNFGLKFYHAHIPKPFSLKVLCFADWAADPDDINIRSTAIFFGSNLILCWSRKQHVVARSSTKGDYRRLVQATTGIIWLKLSCKSFLSPFHHLRFAVRIWIVPNSSL